MTTRVLAVQKKHKQKVPHWSNSISSSNYRLKSSSATALGLMLSWKWNILHILFFKVSLMQLPIGGASGPLVAPVWARVTTQHWILRSNGIAPVGRGVLVKPGWPQPWKSVLGQCSGKEILKERNMTLPKGLMCKWLITKCADVMWHLHTVPV